MLEDDFLKMLLLLLLAVGVVYVVQTGFFTKFPTEHPNIMHFLNPTYKPPVGTSSISSGGGDVLAPAGSTHAKIISVSVSFDGTDNEILIKFPSQQSVYNWKLSTSRGTFTMPSVSPVSGGILNIRSGAGVNSAGSIFINAQFLGTKDTIRLYNASGVLIDTYSY